MRIAALGATGRVGRLVVEQARQRGHEVVELDRRPETRPASGQPTVEIRRADVTAPAAFPDLTDAPGLWAGGVCTGRRNTPLQDYTESVLPPHASRATVAAPMLDEAERPTRAAGTLVPAGRV
ncbi:NAD(P)H-binding protein [Streptomyces sp. NRRL S-340]|uniref:NAD(P)H-binding protein n=1 Tax=Streptomyces sp. NRRL S-340 TaxID=1463901 RepID=UPI00068D5CA3|nr:NAD(P)H-binding protein [Streptomyces sp. NRRL S-340]